MSDTWAIRVVCFDLGGVLVRICRTWGEACIRAGIEIRGGDEPPHPELESEWREAVDLYQSGRIECAEYFRRMARATRGRYEESEVQRIHAAWTCEDYPGAGALVAQLRQRPGILTACLSNTNAAHWRILTGQSEQPGSEAVNRIERHLVSHELGRIKPDALVFGDSLRRLGVRAHEVLFFDDMLENVDAARAQGWDAHHIDHARDTVSQMLTHLRASGVMPPDRDRSGSSC